MHFARMMPSLYRWFWPPHDCNVTSDCASYIFFCFFLWWRRALKKWAGSITVVGIVCFNCVCIFIDQGWFKLNFGWLNCTLNWCGLNFELYQPCIGIWPLHNMAFLQAFLFCTEQLFCFRVPVFFHSSRKVAFPMRHSGRWKRAKLGIGLERRQRLPSEMATWWLFTCLWN